MNCQNCNTIIENGYALCTACELRFAGTLLRLARDVTLVGRDPASGRAFANANPDRHSPDSYQA